VFPHFYVLLLQATLSKLGALAAGAAIFLGGYTTGIASSNMMGDVRTAEMHRQELSAPATASLPVKPVSLALPDQVGGGGGGSSSSSSSRGQQQEHGDVRHTATLTAGCQGDS
jgi:hypothetical protein